MNVALANKVLNLPKPSENLISAAVKVNNSNLKALSASNAFREAISPVNSMSSSMKRLVETANAITGN